MDIYTHALSGLAVGTVAGAFSKQLHPVSFLLPCTLAGAFPDIDSITLWSKFDGVFGKMFGLTHKGVDIYSGTFWYSHHAFFHSLVAALLFAFFLLLIINYLSKNRSISLRDYGLLCIALFLACVIHLFEDMPTPASTWDGVNLLFPAKIYTGGTGKIWWWNNYDIFLITLSVVAINSILLLARHRTKMKIASLSLLVFIIGLGLGIYQINTRQANYAYTGFTKKFDQMEQQSLAEQQRILGKRLFNAMRWFDKHLPGNF